MTQRKKPERPNVDWLIVESFANWVVDKNNGFTHFGITKRFEKLASGMMPGDRLFTYVTGRSCFSDIRRVRRAGVRRLPGGGDYELSLPLCIDTEAILVLPPEGWLSIKDAKDHLILTKSRQDPRQWGPIFRHAPRLLDPADAKFVEAQLTARQTSPVVRGGN